MSYLSINKDGRVQFDPMRLGFEPIVLENLTHFYLYARIATRPVLCSSALDFPEDYTNDPKVIELCRELRT